MKFIFFSFCVLFTSCVIAQSWTPVNLSGINTDLMLMAVSVVVHQLPLLLLQPMILIP